MHDRCSQGGVTSGSGHGPIICGHELAEALHDTAQHEDDMALILDALLSPVATTSPRLSLSLSKRL